jgi:hypothetical protein
MTWEVVYAFSLWFFIFWWVEYVGNGRYECFDGTCCFEVRRNDGVSELMLALDIGKYGK